jgi:hypothetical protein
MGWVFVGHQSTLKGTRVLGEQKKDELGSVWRCSLRYEPILAMRVSQRAGEARARSTTYTYTKLKNSVRTSMEWAFGYTK